MGTNLYLRPQGAKVRPTDLWMHPAGVETGGTPPAASLLLLATQATSPAVIRKGLLRYTVATPSMGAVRNAINRTIVTTTVNLPTLQRQTLILKSTSAPTNVTVARRLILDRALSAVSVLGGSLRSNKLRTVFATVTTLAPRRFNTTRALMAPQGMSAERRLALAVKRLTAVGVEASLARSIAIRINANQTTSATRARVMVTTFSTTSPLIGAFSKLRAQLVEVTASTPQGASVTRQARIVPQGIMGSLGQASRWVYRKYISEASSVATSRRTPVRGLLATLVANANARGSRSVDLITQTPIEAMHGKRFGRTLFVIVQTDANIAFVLVPIKIDFAIPGKLAVRVIERTVHALLRFPQVQAYVREVPSAPIVIENQQT